MKEIVLVTGGCRSGKSAHALALAASIGAGRRYFLATCVPGDKEMKDRVVRHQLDRGDGWETIECPVDISGAIRRMAVESSVVLVDCLTLWVNNLLAETADQRTIEAYVDDLRQAVSGVSGRIILVTNEVGCGIVPVNDTARLFRDLAGLVNQRIAAVADRVVWMVAGVPVIIKGADGR